MEPWQRAAMWRKFMAEQPRGGKGRAPRRRDRRSKNPPAKDQVENSGENPVGEDPLGEAPVGNPGSPSCDTPAVADGRKQRVTTEHEARISELEADLAAAKTTIKALIERVERRNASGVPKSRADVAGPTSKTDGYTLAANLDRVIRQRTRALTESEAQLKRKNNELERINEMKAEFISVAAHELRTPLTSIVGYLDLMAEGSFGDLPKPIERPMASLRRNAYRLKRVVDEMLDVSRIDSGRVTLLRRPCDIGAIVKEVVAEMVAEAKPKKLTLSATVDRPPEIYADSEKIRRMVSKLIANAIRHTPENGAITAAVDTAPPEQFAGVWARIRVKCTGIEIPDELRSRLFEPFSAVNKARHHTSAGPDSAGLGLYIARGLIDLHGGLISVDTAEGAHTEFTVLLPRSETIDRAPSPSGEPDEPQS
jgi:signal transduction histidine kinase